jgi:inner membrane protein
MENVCHTLAGLAFARSGLSKTTPLATTALVVGANLPDVDLAWSSVRSALVYYHEHRGWTHSIAGFFVLTPLLWIALLVIDRAFRARRTGGGARPGPLLLAAALGVSSHILMDAANSYGIRPFLPWSDRWVYGDLWVIVDPWLWLILGGAVFLSGTGGRRRTIVWLMSAACAAAIVLLTPIVPPICRIAWGAALVATVALCLGRAARVDGRPRAARAGLGLAVLYAGLCAVSHNAALARVESLVTRDPGADEPTIATLPHPADPLRWEGIVADSSEIRHASVAAFDGPIAPMKRLPAGLDLEAAGLLSKTCAGAVIREFFRFPFAALEAEPDGTRVIVVRDARYTREGRGFAVYVAPLDRAGAPVVDQSACP